MDMMANFDEVKSKLLKSLGDTPLHAARQWWSISKQPDENHNAFFQRLNNINIRRLEEVNTKQEIINTISLSKFLHSLSHDCFAFDTSRNPATGSEAAELATEFYQSQSRFRSCHYYSTGQRPQASPGGGKDGQPSTSGGEPVVNTGTSTQGAVEQSNGGNQSKSGNKFKSLVCHGCGEPGHIRPNCPQKVKRVSSPTLSHGPSKFYIDGIIADTPSDKVRIDCGSDFTCVADHLVPQSAYIGKHISLEVLLPLYLRLLPRSDYSYITLIKLLQLPWSPTFLMILF